MIRFFVLAALVVAQSNSQDPKAQSNGGLWTTVVTALIGNVLGLVVFLALFHRPSLARVYHFKTRLISGKAPSLSGSYFKDLTMLFTLPNNKARDIISLDAYLFLEFLKKSAMLLAVLSFFALVVLVPVDSTASSLGNDEYSKSSIQNVPEGSSRLWAHIVMSYFFVIMLVGGAYVFMKNYHRIRLSFLQSQEGSLQQRSIVVREIPQAYRSVEGLSDYIGNALGVHEQVIEKIVFVHQDKQLEDALKKRQKALDKYEGLHAKAQLDHKKTTGSTASQETLSQDQVPEKDAHEYKRWSTQLKMWDDKIQDLRAKYTAVSSSAIVTFKSQKHAQMLQKVSWSPSLDKFVVQKAPLPYDMISTNVQMSVKQKFVRNLLFWVIVAAVTLLFAIPVGAISSLLRNLPNYSWAKTSSWPANAITVGLVTGTLPPLVVGILLSLVPPVFTFLAKLSGLESHSLIARRLFTSYFIFLVFNVLLVITVAGSLVESLSQIGSNPAGIVQLLATSLPNVAVFFVNYIILRGLGAFGGSIARIGSVVISTLMRKLFAKSPRQLMNNDFGSGGMFNEGVTWAPIMIVWCLTMVYMVIQPVILPFAALYFFLNFLVYKYQLVWILQTRYETGALIVGSILGAYFTGLYLFCIVQAGLLGLMKSYAGIALLLILIIPVALMHIYIKRQFVTSNLHPILNVKSGSESIPEVHVDFPREKVDNLGKLVEKSAAYDECDYREGPQDFNGVVLDGYWQTYEDPYLVGQLPQVWKLYSSASSDKGSVKSPNEPVGQDQDHSFEMDKK